MEAGCNIQDGVILHSLAGSPVTVEEGSSLAHGCVIHGPCRIGTGSFIGFNSVVYNSNLGALVVVMHGAVIEGVTVPDGLHVPSMSAISCPDDVESLIPATPESLAFAARVSAMNVRLEEAALDSRNGEPMRP